MTADEPNARATPPAVRAPWFARGAGMGAAHFVVRAALGYATLAAPTSGGVFRTCALIAVLAAAAIWGLWDGRAAARAGEEEEAGRDITMLWLKAAVFAGLSSGLACWLLDRVPGVPIAAESLTAELTSSAAFTILAVFAPATGAAALGRKIFRRAETEEKPEAPAPQPAKPRPAASPTPAPLEAATEEAPTRPRRAPRETRQRPRAKDNTKATSLPADVG